MLLRNLFPLRFLHKTPIMQLEVQIELRDKNGKVTKTKRKQCHSYVQQLIDILHDDMAYSFGADIKDTGATMRTLTSGMTPWVVIAESARDSFGIQVGTDNTAVNIAQYHLIAQILEGSSSGHLSHLATSVGSPITVGSTRKFTIARTFTNNSGADITVNEVGLTVKPDTQSWYFLIERTLLSFTIANGTSGTVTYTISVTV